MADVWTDLLFEAAYNGQRLDVQLTEDDMSRVLAEHEYGGIDGADYDDMGGRPRTTRVRVVFFERRGEPLDHLARLERFLADVQRGQAAEFVHPVSGSYDALVSDLRMSAAAEDRGLVVVECTFHQVGIGRLFEEGFVTNVMQASVAVGVQAAAAAELLDELALESTAPADAAAAVAGWEADPELSVREVNQQLAGLSARLAADVEAFDMARDLSHYELWRTYQRLHYQVRKAAESFRQTRSALKVVTVTVGQPLRVLAARLYGARLANEKEAELRRLNDIRDPSYIEVGTEIRYHSPAPVGRRASRAA